MTKMMINENMREKVIDAIAEWMADNTEFSADFLREHGEDWLHVYTLDEMYRDYCGGDLADVINMFADNNVEASTWSDYFVDDNGDLHTDDEFSEVVSEMVFDDNKYAEWVLEEIEEGLIDEPQELMDIVSKYATASWEDVASVIEDERKKAYKKQLERCWLGGGEVCLETFVSASHEVVAITETCDALRDTRFFGADESEYSRIIDDFKTDNLLNVLVADSEEYVSGMHVPFRKALEVVVKNEYLKGRWF